MQYKLIFDINKKYCFQENEVGSDKKIKTIYTTLLTINFAQY